MTDKIHESFPEQGSLQDAHDHPETNLPEPRLPLVNELDRANEFSRTHASNYSIQPGRGEYDKR